MEEYSLQELKELCSNHNLGKCSGRGITRKVLYNKLVNAVRQEKKKRKFYPELEALLKEVDQDPEVEVLLERNVPKVKL